MITLQVRYHVLKTIVNLFGLFEWFAGGYGLLSFYAEDTRWHWAVLVLAVSYLSSCELGYYVNRLQIRLEFMRKNDKKRQKKAS